MLCWRIGRYGDAKPFWVEKDEKQWSQHIYIYQWTGEEIHPLWMASDIGMDVAAFAFDEKKRLTITEKDGKNHLLGLDQLGIGTPMGNGQTENTT